MSVPASQILLYDEQNPFSEALYEDWIARGYRVRTASRDQLTSYLAQENPDVVLINLKGPPDGDLKKLVIEVKEVDDHIPIICLSAKPHLEFAVQLIKQGLYDFIQLPQDQEVLHHTIQNAVHLYQLTKKVFFLERQKGWKGEFWGMVGSDSKMQENFKTITNVAKSRATVLILGESGTGKELVAKAIHALSNRSKSKFIDLNCSAIPKELLENELFGHEKGSYTGADRRYIGSFERANGGTLFLDEIGEMDQALQVKLLRVLQERSFTRVGGTEKTEIDVRFIAATHRNLPEEVKNGNFREDLYYRLNVVPLMIPPLRERREDIPLLAKHFLDLYSAENEKIFIEFQPEALEALMNYDWPGNVRELENVIERVVVLNNESQVKLKHLPEIFHVLPKREGKKKGGAVSPVILPILPLNEMEKKVIESAMNKFKGNITQVAKVLKIGQATLYRKLSKYKIQKKRGSDR